MDRADIDNLSLVSKFEIRRLRILIFRVERKIIKIEDIICVEFMTSKIGNQSGRRNTKFKPAVNLKWDELYLAIPVKNKLLK